MSRPYSEAMAVRLSMIYTPCAISLREQTGDITMFAQFEEGVLALRGQRSYHTI